MLKIYIFHPVLSSVFWLLPQTKDLKVISKRKITAESKSGRLMCTKGVILASDKDLSYNPYYFGVFLLTLIS